MAGSKVTADSVRALFAYDELTGTLTRKVTTSSRAQAGMVVGCKNAAGYLVVRIGPTLYYVHRLIWLHATGSWPTNDIDHIDGNKTNNRLVNLRDVTRTDNLMNRPASGVWWAARDGVWTASITYAGVKTYIGSHKSRQVAEVIYAEHKKRFLL